MPEAPWSRLCSHGIRYTNDNEDDEAKMDAATKAKLNQFFGDTSITPADKV